MGESAITFEVLVIFFAVGIIDGIIYNVVGLTKKLTKNNYIVSFVADFVSCLLGGFLFVLCVFMFEYGYFDAFEIVCFAFGITFEQIFFKNSFAKPFKVVYNKVKSRKKKKEKAVS